MSDESKEPKTILQITTTAIDDIGTRLSLTAKRGGSKSIAELGEALKYACEAQAAILEAMRPKS